MTSGDPIQSARPRTIAVTGSTGSVGQVLCAALTQSGDRVIRLVRAVARCAPDEVLWDPQGGWDCTSLEGIDAVVHLAGENIAAGRWSAARKRSIMQSRSVGTRTLCEKLAALDRPPAVVVSASAVGYYGNCAWPPLDESAPQGDGFLSEVTSAWENALAPLEKRGIRTVRMRIGIVVSANAGVVGKMRLPFQLGLGGRVGSGAQGMSWIHIDDLVAAIRFAIAEKQLTGAVNAVAPNPVSQHEFARALARALHRPCFAPLPGWAVRFMLGEMGSALLLGGQFVLPSVLVANGFRFKCECIDDAMRRTVTSVVR
ncbi:MAG: TIGR01777 family protein [Phycisphaerales bacterium]|nr:TIGR01777 family protein [Phycisphaerales bacterium]